MLKLLYIPDDTAGSDRSPSLQGSMEQDLTDSWTGYEGNGIISKTTKAGDLEISIKRFLMLFITKFCSTSKLLSRVKNIIQYLVKHYSLITFHIPRMIFVKLTAYST